MMTKVFLRPIGMTSPSILRVAGALRQFAPEGIEFTEIADEADLRVLHIVGNGSIEGIDLTKPYAMLQYCLKSTERGERGWLEEWQNARTVWSYYDLAAIAGSHWAGFMYAPLGVDPAFTKFRGPMPKDIDVMSSGYVSHAAAEAIQEIADAACINGMRVMHLGPEQPEGFRKPTPLQGNAHRWTNVFNVSDEIVAVCLTHSRYVSGLRHVEGFELPAVEGLCCGARPILFDRPEMRQWYDGHAVFVPECSGTPLVDLIAGILRQQDPVSDEERRAVAQKFNWEPLVNEFWRRAL